MKLVSINKGAERAIERAGKSGKTGIYKLPQSGPVEITALGIPQDAIIDSKHHGGPDQALYLYGLPDYAWWSAELGRELAPGTFGENMTFSELESAACAIGDCFQVGAVLLQVTAPRIPCSTLAARMGDPAFVKHFRAAERPGLYCRVLQTGSVQAGDSVTYLPERAPSLTVLQAFRDFYTPQLSEAAVRRQLAAPIASRTRAEMEDLLRKILAQPDASAGAPQP